MSRPIPVLLVALLLGSSTPLRAQLPEWVDQLLTAAQLPVVAADGRREGIPSNEIRAALDAMNRAGMPAHEAKVVMDTARMARRDHGAVDNFGAFVQAQLAAGKRGQALAAAIRAEHMRQGKGRAAHDGPGEGRGKPDEARGKRDTAPARRGKP